MNMLKTMYPEVLFCKSHFKLGEIHKSSISSSPVEQVPLAIICPTD